MLPVPFYINIIFLATAILAMAIFYFATRKSVFAVSVLFAGAVLQVIIGYSGFYTDTSSVPPRFLLMVLPAIATVISLFVTSSGKRFIDTLELRWLTLIHFVRLPIEIVLYWLFIAKTIPQVMTFEGRNLDIIMGISAPLVFYLFFIRKKVSSQILLAWNLLGVILVLNVAITGVLSTPLAFQQFGFEQPNIAVLNFPFNLLPALLVPLVLFAHFASIRIIIQSTIAVKGNDNANVVIFPPLLFVITALLALSSKLITPAIAIPIVFQEVGYFLGGIGGVVLVLAVRQLNIYGTTVHPDGSTTVIVSNGIFRYSRNPIYLSFTLLYLGVVLVANAILGLVLILPLLIMTQKGIIEREEKYLLKKFGEEYAQYKSTVRRWI
ncbi:MAG: isoprenylcysteine carboxylmethyltransferase family protein [Cytophagales bacterium]|nr:isoprenylcysteine carboxylmethyltransferase family protein [Cytophagales bacterium]